MKILITAGTSATALKLSKAFKNGEVILGDYDEVPKFLSSQYTLVSLGERNDDTIAHSLLNNCLDLEVNTILPLSVFEIEAVAKSIILFEEFNIEVLLPNPENLNTHFNEVENEKSEDWAIFSKGNVIFTTNSNEAIIGHGVEEKLSGAYFLTPSLLKLITV